MIEINKIYNENCLDTLNKMPDNFIDLTITSPPYDNLRNYNGYSFEFEKIANELLRVTKKGGVIVWVVGDSVINGSESGTSFKQALFFKEIGFNLHDTMIYQKDAMPFPEQNRYNQCFEYMFILSKGKPKTFNSLKEKTKDYKPSKSSTTRNNNGETIKLKYEQGKNERNLFNIWKINCGFNKSSNDLVAFQHPAMFPEELVKKHIYTWSNENDLIYDCFGGSGTTAKMAHLQKRNWILSEISKEYVNISEKRLNPYLTQTTLF